MRKGERSQAHTSFMSPRTSTSKPSEVKLACPRKNLPGILASVNAQCKTGNNAVVVHQAHPVPCLWSLSANPRPCDALYQLERHTWSFLGPWTSTLSRHAARRS